MDTLTPRELWIQAIRSGKYKQGRYYLCEGDKYCCLGVACEVYQEHVGDLEIEISNGFKYYDGEGACLPEKVIKWFKLNASYGESRVFNEALSELNDDGSSFEEIADILEKDDGYFKS